MSLDAVIQAVLTGYDTQLNRQWRGEDRQWRSQDMNFRDRECHHLQVNEEAISDGYLWRAQDLEQRALENGRFIWSRFVEKNRRDVEERSEQLKGVSNLSALIAGFAIVAFLEFNFDVDHTSQVLNLAFGLTTALTAGLMINAMVVCSLMQASILKSGKQYVSETEEALFISACRKFALHYTRGDAPPAPRRTFEQHWNLRCEGEFRAAFFMFSSGIVTFLVNLNVAAGIRFSSSLPTILAVTAVLALALLYFLSAQSRWGGHVVGRTDARLKDFGVRPFGPHGLPFDWHKPSTTHAHHTAKHAHRDGHATPMAGAMPFPEPHTSAASAGSASPPSSRPPSTATPPPEGRSAAESTQPSTCAASRLHSGGSREGMVTNSRGGRGVLLPLSAPATQHGPGQPKGAAAPHRLAQRRHSDDGPFSSPVSDPGRGAATSPGAARRAAFDSRDSRLAMGLREAPFAFDCSGPETAGGGEHVERRASHALVEVVRRVIPAGLVPAMEGTPGRAVDAAMCSRGEDAV